MSTAADRQPPPLVLTSLLCHACAAASAASGLGIQAQVELHDHALAVVHGSQRQRWPARFMGLVGGRLAYTPVPGPQTGGFAGWQAYPLRRWLEATDKRAFKVAATRLGVPVPSACTDPARIGGPFLVKQACSSFGEGQRGPFLEHDAGDTHQQLGAGEYYENFLVGVSAKAWCWGERCVALELQSPLLVTGDGARSLRSLVHALPPTAGRRDWDLVRRLAAYCGVSGLDEVVPTGLQVLVEHRYGAANAFPPPPAADALGTPAGAPLAPQFHAAAQALASCLPQGHTPAKSLYTLDAMVDADGQAWFLEMNCNPLVHPHAYAHLLADCFGLPPPGGP